jgi:hypothetical protein
MKLSSSDASLAKFHLSVESQRVVIKPVDR